MTVQAKFVGVSPVQPGHAVTVEYRVDGSPVRQARAVSVPGIGAFPQFVTARTCTTADKELAWLNRAQFIGLGRVDMKALRVAYDVYVSSR